MSSSEAGYQPGDWHETLVDLLAMDRGIPEDRARRFLARHAEEVRASAPVTCHTRECPCPPGCGCCPAIAEIAPDLKTQVTEAEALAGRWEEVFFDQVEKRSEALAAIDRVQKASTEPETMNANEPGYGSYLRGYKHGVLATKGALRSPDELATADSDKERQSAAYWERAAQENGDLYSDAENQRDEAREQLAEARAAIARVQAVAREWEFMSGRTAARNELLAALNGPAEKQR